MLAPWKHHQENMLISKTELIAYRGKGDAPLIILISALGEEGKVQIQILKTDVGWVFQCEGSSVRIG